MALLTANKPPVVTNSAGDFYPSRGGRGGEAGQDPSSANQEGRVGDPADSNDPRVGRTVRIPC
eukprot:634603-Prorocentrum_minimum.AAC.1